MNLQSMDYIVTTANERSISRAAEILHVTQQTLSAHISAVERELGCQLFVRHIPLEITYAGEEFLKYAESIRHQVREMRRTFGEIAGEEKGQLKIGVTGNRGRIVLMPIVARYLKEHPQIEIRVLEDANEGLIRRLSRGELDVCISDLEAVQPGIRQADLYRERMVFVVQRELFRQLYPENSKQVIRAAGKGDYRPLQDCPLLLGREKDIAGKFSHRAMASFDRPPVIRVEAENIAFALELCAHGLGGCFCPEIIVRNTLTAEQMEEVLLIPLGKQGEYPIRIGWREEGRIIASFIETAQEQVKGMTGAG